MRFRVRERSPRIPRRVFLQSSTASAALAAFGRGAVVRPQRVRRPSAAVIGGGVAGLTAAQELAERGFEIVVYERQALGGKARSFSVPHTAADGRQALPGEHGFHFLPGFYRNLPDTMRRIPATESTSVHDNLVATGGVSFSRAGGREDLTLAVPDVLTPDTLLRTLIAALQELKALPPDEAEFFAQRLVVYMTSSDARRRGEWEYVSWWDFVKAAQMSAEYQRFLASGLTRNLVAVRPTVASTHTIGLMAEAFIYCAMGFGSDGPLFRVLNGPADPAWITPWEDHLRSLGVKFRLGWSIDSLRMAADGRIGAAEAHDHQGRRRLLTADWFICAVPVEKASPLWGRDILQADPRLRRVARLNTDWMNGIQFYLRRKAPLAHGHVSYVDSPWALVSISEAQFWSRPFADTYGNGTVRDCLSVNIADWDTPGLLYNKAARHCTPAEIAREVWTQLKASLDDTGRNELADSILYSWSLDPAITGAGTPRGARNREPLLINTVGSWDDRPAAATAIPNLFLAADYVRDNVNLATMEGANETARAAVNAILERAHIAAPRCPIYRLYQPPELVGVKEIDAQRFKRGQPNLFDEQTLTTRG